MKTVLTRIQYAFLIICSIVPAAMVAQLDTFPCCIPLIPPTYIVSETHWDEPSSFWQNGGHIPENIVDEDSTNYARAHIKATGSATVRVTDSLNTYPAGAFAGFKIKSRAFRDANFYGVTISIYLDGTLLESHTGEELMVEYIPDDVNDPICIGFIAAESWNEVEVRFDREGPRVHYDVFFAVIQGDGCPEIDDLPPGLPVTWISFEAEVKGNSTVLTWATAEEFNNAGFEIERSDDGILFNQIGKVDPASAAVAVHNYYFHDDNPVKGINYYRIRQVDIDGGYSYSVIRTVAYQHLVSDIRVWPNPVNDDRITIELGNNVERGVIRMINSSGSVVYTQSFGENDYRATMSSSGLNPGIYTVIIESPGQLHVDKVMILR